MDIPAAELNRVLSPEVAHRFYEDGALRWRKPHHGRRIAPSGLDTDSMDFRGQRAVFTVTKTLREQFDKDGKRIADDPGEVIRHYEIGLAAIRNAGLLPLDERFEEGYNRWANAIVDEATLLAEKAHADSAPPSVDQ